jgi:two-component system LytT family response regulator
MKIRVLIVDDEPLARQRIRDLLKKDSSFEIVGESGNGIDAISQIQQQSPDLVFLDVQMPELNGFEVLETVGVENIPQVIFVTAYDQYALQAFEVHALDYLLKPFDPNRFKEALNRARDHLEMRKNGEFSTRLKEMLQEVKAETKYLDRLIVKTEGRIFFIKTDEIYWIGAAGNYVSLHVSNDEHLVRETMHGIENKLDPNKFIRIHRSTIVNLERIKEIQPWFNGEYLVILNDDTRLTMSRKYRERFKDYF